MRIQRRGRSRSRAAVSLQAASYSLLSGIEIVRYIIITKTRAPKIQELVTHCGEPRLRLMRDTIRQVDAAIQAGCFPRNTSVMTCSGCEFRNRCLGTAVPLPSQAVVSAA